MVPTERDKERESIPQLLGDLIKELRDLLQQEIALAKTEVRENLSRFQQHLALIAVGGALLLAAALFLLAALNRGVTSLLAQFIDLEVAVWLAPLLLALVVGGAGVLVLKRGTRALAADHLVPEKTLDTLKENQRWIREKAG